MTSGGDVGEFRVVIKNSAKPDLAKLKQHQHLRDRFDQVIATLKHNPYAPTDRFEKFQPPSARFYSRRLNGQHRVIYTVDDITRTVTIYAAWSHYE
ncbi:MAG: Txe/YoeB family addiction module toxin [Propionibacteriaceae bacterium]|nr:Txe/YoeB family addiction module toxin [Propionibacteriaceae bacterium]